MSKRQTLHLTLVAAIALCLPWPAQAQTHFDRTVAAGGAGDWDTLEEFSIPTGVGANRKTMARVMSTAPIAGVRFRVTQKPPATGKTTADITVDVGVGSIDDMNSGEPVAGVVRAQTHPSATAAAGWTMMLITIEYDPLYNFPAMPEVWLLQAERGAAARRFVGVIATGTDPVGAPNEVEVLSTRSKMAPITTLEFGDVQTNLPDTLMPVRNYSIQNVGTDTLTIVGSINPPAGAFAVFGGFGISPIEPMGTLSVPIRFKPIMQGQGPANDVMMAINSNDPDPDQTVRFRGRGVSLEGIMLMDLSGSMACTLDGQDCFGVPEQQQRVWHAKQAGLQLYQAYSDLTGGQARFGIYGFPDPNGAAASAFAPVPINLAGFLVGPVTTALGPIGTGGLQADGVTPISAGLIRSRDDLPNAADTLRPTIIMLSDGAHNEPFPPTPPQPDDVIGSLMAKGIRVFPVGYGVPGTTDVDHALLQRLADGTGGTSLPANPTDFLALKKAFYTGLGEWIGLQDVADPKSTIAPSQNKTHDICIDDQARAIVFTVNWGLNQMNAVEFTLRTPTGVTVTAGPNASVFRSPGGTMWVVKGDLVRQGAGAGLWTMVLRGASNLPGSTEYGYTAQVLSYVATPSTFTGFSATFANWQMAVNLTTVQPAVLGGSKVVLRYNRPDESYGTYLSTGKIDPAWLARDRTTGALPGARADVALAALQRPDRPTRAPAVLLGENASMAQRKAWALANIADQPFGDKRSTGTLELFDNGTNGDAKAGDGIFSAIGFETRVDGLYDMVLEIVGQASPRQCIQRAFPISKYIKVGLDAARIAQATQWANVEVSPFFDDQLQKLLTQDPEPGTERRMVVTTLQDQGGNFYGPGHVNDVRFTLKDARAIGAVQDRLDGSYVQVVEFASNASPIATVLAAGVTSMEVVFPRSAIPLWVWILLLILLLILILWIVLKRRPATP